MKTKDQMYVLALKKIINDNFKSQNDFAEAVGITTATISRTLNLKTSLSWKFKNQIYSYLVNNGYDDEVLKTLNEIDEYSIQAVDVESLTENIKIQIEESIKTTDALNIGTLANLYPSIVDMCVKMKFVKIRSHQYNH